ncbi:putative propionyl-CoA carboxylase beta chain 5 [Corynebacterium occultum]|uniref:Putative propionyl-CoA carboxylase beta chain 5 n=1 Tax=Corynebacterium occultum TaxID=2675219 RepID=A0A6B8VM74_9CORY|nr:acyl-CoA carboxylase subunit beta [Corynebacterium occultum]QGU06572.1 putative propionyl-CoA carboxylase beta chain 5 [Corynebacterium occultum]
MTAAESDLTTTSGKLADLRKRLSETLAPVGEAAVAATHAAGRATARERITHLLDEGSFVEVDALARHRATAFGMEANRPVTDGVVTGYGTVAGRKVCVFSQDASIFEGAMGEVYGEKLIKILQLATKTGVPLIGVHEGAGARVKEGVVSLAMYAKVLALSTQASGIIPQIAVVTGATSGAHALIPALSDILVTVEGDSELYLTAPGIASTVAGREISGQELGGAGVQRDNGTSHHSAESDLAALDWVRSLLAQLPANHRSEAPRLAVEALSGSVRENLTDSDRELDSLIPDSDAQTYDVHEVLTRVVDDGELLELQAAHAPNIITALARVEGRTVGVVANQPTVLAGCLDIKAATKAARFIRTCDAFNIPIVEFVDAPGFLPGTEQEHGGILAAVAKLSYATAEASVGKITVITRKALGGAYVVMGAKDLGTDLVFAWPTAEIAVTDAPSAVESIYADKLSRAAEKGEDVAALAADYAAEYEESHINPYLAAERGLVDAVIPPSETRGNIIEGLRLLDRKVLQPLAKKHGNIPL